MIMTSPPYWSLRDYGESAKAIWGGNPKCKHVFRKKATHKRNSGGTRSSQVKMHRDGITEFTHTSQFCSKCGACKCQLGMESDIDLFTEHLVDVFNEAKRVLKDTGTCWVNLGDTYYSKSGNSYAKDRVCSLKRAKAAGLDKANTLRESKELKPKCLSLIPFRFAIAMINRGWILRNVIIWHKPNCVPSSARDRFTVDFEYLFFFSKSKKYYFEKQYEPMKKGKVKDCNPLGRNKRSIWAINSKPLSEAHFAVFPEEFCETPIKAGCPEKVCRKCGMPQLTIQTGGNQHAFNIRVSDVKRNKIKYIDRRASKKETDNYRGKYASELKSQAVLECQCNVGFSPGIVLDPFMGSGTTALVAKKLNKNFIGFELNPDYIKISEKRLNKSA